MTKKKNMKKMLNVLTAKAIIVSSISGAVLTPSLTALAAEDQNVVGAASTGTQSIGLLNFNWELDSADKLTYWISQSNITASSNIDTYTKLGNVYTTSDGFKTITVNSDNSFTLSSTKLSHTIAQNVATEIGKEYTISTRVQQNAVPAQDGAQLIVGDKKMVPTSKDELVSYTFVATSTSTKISFVNRKNFVGTRTVTFGDIYAGRSAAQLEKDNAAINARAAVNNLFENQDPTGQIRADLTQAEIDAAQKLIFLVSAPAERLPIGDNLRKAQEQLNERNAQSKAELEAAENAVKTLFNNDDVTGTIKDSVNQEAINNAKELVATVKDADKKAELESQIAEAQKQLDAKAGEVAEQARQEAATNAVKELFNNNDVTGTIKDATNQAAIDNAKELVAAVTDADKKAELETQIAEAQKQLDAKAVEAAEQARQEAATNVVKELFNNNDVTGTIKDVTNQAAINNAKTVVEAVTNPTKKAELTAQLDEAQDQLNIRIAKIGVSQLFNNDDVTGTIKDVVTQSYIDAIQNLVNEVSNPAEKAKLQADLNKAQAQLDAKGEATEDLARQEAASNAVKALFNNDDVTGAIKESTNQDAINKAKELVAAVTNATKKAELEAQVTEAQKQLDAKTEAVAEQARQEAAKKAVEDLFNNNDVTGTIKEDTTQDAIDKAKELVSTLTDADKKAELEAQIAEAQKQLTEKETKVEVTGKGNTFILQQDRYLTGTYTGDAASMSVEVNGKLYYGGTVKNGEYSFYALDKIASASDKVIINLHSADKKIQVSFPVVVKEATKVTQNAFKVKDSYITGTFNNSDITKMGIVVNGKAYWGGTVADGKYNYYALDKITSATDEVVLNFYNANNELIISKNLVITAPVVTSGDITSASLAVGDKNIVGTITGDIKSFGVTIDGTVYNGGTIAADGTFKFYVSDKKFTADSVITIVGYDKSKKALSEMNLVVSK